MFEQGFNWPAAAHVGIRIPKEKIYSHAKGVNSIKTLFVSQVDKIEWAYKLAPTSVNIPASPSIPEIQIFRLHARLDDIDIRVLRAIDSVIGTPIIYEIVRSKQSLEEVQTRAAIRPGSTSNFKAGKYYTSGWVSSDKVMASLPVSLSLEALYLGIIQTLSGTSLSPSVSVGEGAAKLHRIDNLTKELARIESKARREKQFKRRFELRRQANKLREELNGLS